MYCPRNTSLSFLLSIRRVSMWNNFKLYKGNTSNSWYTVQFIGLSYTPLPWQLDSKGEDNMWWYVMVYITTILTLATCTQNFTIPSTSEELSFQRSKSTETKAGFCFSSVSRGHRTCCILASLMSTSEPMTLSLALQACEVADQRVSTRYLNAVA